MLLGNGQFLSSTRLSRVLLDQATKFQQRLPRRFLDRLPLVPATDNEITARITSKNYAADLVADGQAAVVRQSIQLNYVATAIPNIKSGIDLPQSLLSLLDDIQSNLRGSAATDPDAAIALEEAGIAFTLLGNVRDMMNVMACGMFTDSFTYNRNGVIVNATFGCPSDLKATSSPLWTSTSATPITDINTMRQHALTTYGESYNRVTLSTADLTNAWATTEFKTLVAGLSQIAAPLSVSNFNTRDPRNAQFLAALIGCEIETEDKIYNIINPDGTQSSGKVLALGKVLLSNTADDNEPGTWDFANAIVTESLTSQYAGGLYDFPAGKQRGPVAYYAPKSVDMNPPGLNAWGVARGFPRKHRPTACAVLTVQ